MREKQALEIAKQECTALTFNDLRLRTGYSKVMPANVSLKTKFSRNVSLEIPVASAAMDTVTESRLAIELAKLGGIGVIHKNLGPEEQARHVARVKNHLNGRIRTPIRVYEDETIGDILKRREEKEYGFHSFPVISRADSTLVGIITATDFDFCGKEDMPKKALEVMTRGPRTAKSDTTLNDAYGIMREFKIKSLPLVDAQNRVVGMYVLKDVKRIMERSALTYNLDNQQRLRVAAAIGTDKEALERLEKLVAECVDVIVIDTAHGDSEPVYETLKTIKKNHPKLDVVVGNISVGDSAKRLADAGADGIKVGQGPGSICTTRIIAGVGRPQVSAVYDCARATESYEIPICADGGLVNSGDIPIAIACGAYSVMMGSMLAGTEESPGDIVFYKGRQWKRYRGMGSLSAMEQNKGSRDRYLQEESAKDRLVPEGMDGLTPFKGRLETVMHQYVGGLRKGMGYVGAASIEELRDKGEFDRITHAGLAESHPHDIEVTVEAPNYNRGRL
ncbi:MAG: IMP dehydrogenase [archaeon]|jgi:IMP dehydrogenase|nr:IMP dehydrogenase [archaeon]